MGDELRADLHEFVADTGQRPVLHLLRKRESAKKIGDVVGKRMKLNPRRRVRARTNTITRFQPLLVVAVVPGDLRAGACAVVDARGLNDPRSGRLQDRRLGKALTNRFEPCDRALYEKVITAA